MLINNQHKTESTLGSYETPECIMFHINPFQMLCVSDPTEKVIETDGEW